MNSFFARVEDKDSAGGECQIYDVTNEEKVVIEEWEVKGVFARAKARKACGPDGVKPRVLKACAAQLVLALYPALFSRSFSFIFVPPFHSAPFFNFTNSVIGANSEFLQAIAPRL